MPNENDWVATLGKRVIGFKADEHRIVLNFEDGSAVEISSCGGTSRNEGEDSWLEWQLVLPS